MQTSPNRLLLHVLLGLSPILLLVAALDLVLWRSGELTPVSKVATEVKADGPPASFLRMFVDQNIAGYRLKQLEARRPDVLILGSSRVQRFRREMFAEAQSFYNASGTISNVLELEQLAASWPGDYRPRVVLVGVDSWWFNQAYTAKAQARGRQLTQTEHLSSTVHFYACQRLLHAVLRRRISLSHLSAIARGDNDGVTRFGLLAWLHRGFRNDGGLQTNRRHTPTAYKDREQPPVIQRLRRGLHQFTPTTEFDSELLRRFVGALSSVVDDSTVVLGFAPPFSTEVNHAIADSPSWQRYHASYRNEVARAFADRGWGFVDYSDVSKVGLDDRALEDGFHALETYHVALLAAIAEDPMLARQLGVDREKLLDALKHPDTTAWYPVY